jgi:XTP/dITP diphosphohydrolase
MRGSMGFGYDPLFIPLGEDRSMAEMTRDEKAAISHRGRAVRRLAELLRPVE